MKSFVTELFLHFCGGLCIIYSDTEAMKVKKRFLNCLAMVLVMLLSFSVLSVRPSAKGSEAPVKSASYDANEALKARFLNMLNHNFAYELCGVGAP